MYSARNKYVDFFTARFPGKKERPEGENLMGSTLVKEDPRVKPRNFLSTHHRNSYFGFMGAKASPKDIKNIPECKAEN